MEGSRIRPVYVCPSESLQQREAVEILYPRFLRSRTTSKMVDNVFLGPRKVQHWTSSKIDNMVYHLRIHFDQGRLPPHGMKSREVRQAIMSHTQKGKYAFLRAFLENIACINYLFRLSSLIAIRPRHASTNISSSSSAVYSLPVLPFETTDFARNTMPSPSISIPHHRSQCNSTTP